MNNRCTNCAKYPFCNKIKDSQQEACESFLKNSLQNRKDELENEQR